MTPITHANGQTIALFGLGGSGLATARALRAGGARVVACDDSAAQMEKAAAEGVETADLRGVDWTGVQSLVLSPGVPLTHKDGQPFTHWTVTLARQHGVDVIGDIELFCRERRAVAPGAPFIAITGTNGKSTTTALVAHILREAGVDVQMGGNIGTAVLSLEPPATTRVHVIECSSFQIDLAPTLAIRTESATDPSLADIAMNARVAEIRFAGPGMRNAGGATVGVLLNITPDHIDRHGDIENYVAIKKRLVFGATYPVVGFDDEHCRRVCEELLRLKRRFWPVSSENSLGGAIYYDDGHLHRVIATTGPLNHDERLIDLRRVGSLRGAHNGQNAAAAFSVCEALDISHDAITNGLHTFPGLAHRMEQLGRIGRAMVINDSKATNADSTEKALLSFSGDIFWILGGKSKEGGVEPLKPYFAKVAKAYLIGAATEEFAATLDGDVAFERCGTLDAATSAAARDATQSPAAEPVILLSPACASYDQYPNFEVRGDAFRALVKALPGFVPIGV